MKDWAPGPPVHPLTMTGLVVVLMLQRGEAGKGVKQQQVMVSCVVWLGGFGRANFLNSWHSLRLVFVLPAAATVNVTKMVKTRHLQQLQHGLTALRGACAGLSGRQGEQQGRCNKGVRVVVSCVVWLSGFGGVSVRDWTPGQPVHPLSCVCFAIATIKV